jgi:PAS domain-containing protein
MLNFKKNGKKYWNLLRIAPVRDLSGAVTHYVGIQTDVTLMRERELGLKKIKERRNHG